MGKADAKMNTSPTFLSFFQIHCPMVCFMQIKEENKNATQQMDESAMLHGRASSSQILR